MGRPTKYTDAIQEAAEAYLEGEITEWIDKHEREREFITYGNNRSVIPSVEGLSKHLGVSRSTVYLWRDQYEAFSDTLAAVEAEQKEVTLNEGLKGNFNATIAKLVLANHGMHDKVDEAVSFNVTLESDSEDL